MPLLSITLDTFTLFFHLLPGAFYPWYLLEGNNKVQRTGSVPPTFTHHKSKTKENWPKPYFSIQLPPLFSTLYSQTSWKTFVLTDPISSQSTHSLYHIPLQSVLGLHSEFTEFTNEGQVAQPNGHFSVLSSPNLSASFNTSPSSSFLKYFH